MTLWTPPAWPLGVITFVMTSKRFLNTHTQWFSRTLGWDPGGVTRHLLADFRCMFLHVISSDAHRSLERSRKQQIWVSPVCLNDFKPSFLLCSTGILGSTSRLPQTSPICMPVWNRGLRVSVTSCYTQQLLHLGGATPSATVWISTLWQRRHSTYQFTKSSSFCLSIAYLKSKLLPTNAHPMLTITVLKILQL